MCGGRVVVLGSKTNLTLRVIDWQEKKPDTNQWSTSVRSKGKRTKLNAWVFPSFLLWPQLVNLEFWHRDFQELDLAREFKFLDIVTWALIVQGDLRHPGIEFATTAKWRRREAKHQLSKRPLSDETAGLMENGGQCSTCRNVVSPEENGRGRFRQAAKLDLL